MPKAATIDKLCTKQDAATIALVGEKVDNEVITVGHRPLMHRAIGRTDEPEKYFCSPFPCNICCTEEWD